MTYYNEFDPKAAAWLLELISAGLIPAGHVDTRSIADVKPSDLDGFTQCHFFAGIGGWPYALRLAGWPDDEPVWTGSCPCQPFSAAGKQRGTEDERHLWPELARLVAKCRPSTVFGEQVASKLGREWLAGVRVDLEGMGFAVGASDLCAAGVGAPHIRQRLYWVADSNAGRRQTGTVLQGCGKTRDSLTGNGSEPCGVADLRCAGLEERPVKPTREERQAVERSGDAGRLEHSTGDRRCERGAEPSGGSVVGGCCVGGVGHADGDDKWRNSVPRSHGKRQSVGRSSGDGFWSDFEVIPCRDGKARRVEPGTFPLAHGVSGRVGLLRGYGNAIVPQVAAEFIRAFCESMNQ